MSELPSIGAFERAKKNMDEGNADIAEVFDSPALEAIALFTMRNHDRQVEEYGEGVEA